MDAIKKKQIDGISNGRILCSISLIDITPKTKKGIIIAIKKYCKLSVIRRKIKIIKEMVERKRISFFLIGLLKVINAPPKIMSIPT
jgi:hypothetical protein